MTTAEKQWQLPDKEYTKGEEPKLYLTLAALTELLYN